MNVPMLDVPTLVDRLARRFGTTRGLERIEACLRGFAAGRPPTATAPLHEPTRLWFPGLGARPWYERSELPWVRAIEDEAPAIADELAALLRADTPFHPYEDPYTLELGWRGWGTFCLYRKGRLHERNAARCPRTMGALSATPHGPRQGMFSRLEPGTHLEPHSGGVNTILTCHLALVVPPGCALRVGGETRGWTEGEVTIFDDSFVHEAWNRGPSDRLVLLWDVWHPDLTPLEIEALTLVFSTFDQMMRRLGG